MFKGSNVALVTPFKDNKLDEETYIKLIHFHIENGTNGLVPAGTTGESPTLSHQEHEKVIELCVKESNQKLPVFAGTGSNSTEEAISLTRHAEKIGANGALIVTPYYNKPTQEGLYQHYKAIADATAVPIVLYNVPPRTGCDMQADTVARLSEIDGIVGIKEACGDAQRVAAIKGAVADDFFVLSGEDAQTLQMLELGAVGTISVTANILPQWMADFCNRFLTGDRQGAAEIDARLQPVHDILFVESSPTPVKWALADHGRIEAGIRLPLIPLSEQHHAAVRQRIAQVGGHS